MKHFCFRQKRFVHQQKGLSVTLEQHPTLGMALQEKQLQTIKLFLEECKYTKGVETNAREFGHWAWDQARQEDIQPILGQCSSRRCKRKPKDEVNKVAEMFLVVEAKSCKDKKYFPQATQTL
jgi:hypothetical protein